MKIIWREHCAGYNIDLTRPYEHETAGGVFLTLMAIEYMLSLAVFTAP